MTCYNTIDQNTCGSGVGAASVAGGTVRGAFDFPSGLFTLPSPQEGDTAFVRNAIRLNIPAQFVFLSGLWRPTSALTLPVGYWAAPSSSTLNMDLNVMRFLGTGFVWSILQVRPIGWATFLNEVFTNNDDFLPVGEGPQSALYDLKLEMQVTFADLSLYRWYLQVDTGSGFPSPGIQIAQYDPALFGTHNNVSAPKLQQLLANGDAYRFGVRRESGAAGAPVLTFDTIQHQLEPTT